MVSEKELCMVMEGLALVGAARNIFEELSRSKKNEFLSLMCLNGF